jgi:3-dehydroquinate synthase
MNKPMLFYTAQRWNRLNKFLHQKQYSSIILLYDTKLSKQAVKFITRELKPDVIIPFHASEESKSLAGVQNILSAVALSGADRQTVFVNAGGGSLCDAGAFSASVFKRGVDFINIPTTLMAQCDAAIGGKTSLNHVGIKNIIGTIHFPAAVLIDPMFLKTLDSRNLISGFAEIIKTAIIADKVLFRMLLNQEVRQHSDFSKLAVRSAKNKMKITASDPYDRNIRKALNFGHTIGHAIESFTMHENDKWFHGEAVAFGMICESFIAFQKKLMTIKELNSVTDLILQYFRLPAIPEHAFDQLFYFMSFDKKNKSGNIHFSLPDGIGACKINQTATHDQIVSALQYSNFVFQHNN